MFYAKIHNNINFKKQQKTMGFLIAFFELKILQFVV